MKKGSRVQINVSRLQITAIPIEVLNRITPFYETWLKIFTIYISFTNTFLRTDYVRQMEMEEEA